MTPALRIAALGMLIALGALAGVAAGQANAADDELGPSPHLDALDAAGGVLDLTEVTFGQQGTRLRLRMRTAAEWKAGELSPDRTLCVIAYVGDIPTPHLRICVATRATEAALTYARLTPQGGVQRSGVIDALVERPDRRTIEATFTPLAARLPLGSFSWEAESRWTGDGVADRVPEIGRIEDTARLLAVAPCFGAAARDPLHPCRNPALRLAVIPTPSRAVLLPNAFCRPTGRRDLVSPCAFGAAPDQASATVALIGDSHAEHWRGAVEVVAQAKRWRGLSITRSSCPFALGTPIPPQGEAARKLCVRWNRQVLRWLRRHPEVRTIVVSANDVTRHSGPPGAGFRATWKALPSSVRRVIVLRDTPHIVGPQAPCVARALAHRRPPGRLCAQSRASNLTPDPQVAAARALHSRRVRLVDLSRHLCDDEVCFAVVGGALVHKDGTHLTATFAQTLGPYLLRAIDRL